MDDIWLDETLHRSQKEKLTIQWQITEDRESLKWTDKLPAHIVSTNPPPPLIPADGHSLTESSISLSGGYLYLKDDIESASSPEQLPPEPNIDPERAD